MGAPTGACFRVLWSASGTALQAQSFVVEPGGDYFIGTHEGGMRDLLFPPPCPAQVCCSGPCAQLVRLGRGAQVLQHLDGEGCARVCAVLKELPQATVLIVGQADSYVLQVGPHGRLHHSCRLVPNADMRIAS